MENKALSSSKQESIFPQFLKYVSANVLGMIGFSCYILADTFFIARGIGANALAALNLALPAYSLMNGTGLMIGMGAAARYSLSAAQPKDKVHQTVFTHALYLSVLAAVIFSSAGALIPGPIARLLGADGDTIGYATDYLRILLVFSPLFLGNNLLTCFVRNDGAPRLSMAAMITGSLANIVLDYVFVYPLDMGMTGAAIATATAPLLGMLVASIHFIKRHNRFRPMSGVRFSLWRWKDICALGVSSLISELSSGIVIIVFNFLILSLNGNTGVAAYGILANIALVLVAIFTGIAQGIQPIVSKYAASGSRSAEAPSNSRALHSIRRYALISALLMALIAYTAVTVWSVPIADIFNRDHDPVLTEIASGGMKIYFISLFFSGINIVAASFLSSADRPRQAFIVSILRGFLLIIPVAWLLATLAGLTGIWMAVPVTEGIVSVLALVFLFKHNENSGRGDFSRKKG